MSTFLQNQFEQNVITTSVDYVFNWARKSSLWPLTFGLACCAIEMIASSTSRFDIARFGAEVFRPSPRQSDLMIVAGTVTLKMAPVLKRIWDQMPDPKWCISMGACSSVGGPFNTYAVLQGVDKIVPVDVYRHGLPAAAREPLLRADEAAGQDRPDDHAGEAAHRSAAGRIHAGELQAAGPHRARSRTRSNRVLPRFAARSIASRELDAFPWLDARLRHALCRRSRAASPISAMLKQIHSATCVAAEGRCGSSGSGRRPARRHARARWWR